MADGGYDIADYRDIDPLFGSLADAEAMIAEAHGHGIRVLVDLVPTTAPTSTRGSGPPSPRGRVGRAGTVPLPAGAR